MPISFCKWFLSEWVSGGEWTRFGLFVLGIMYLEFLAISSITLLAIAKILIQR